MIYWVFKHFFEFTHKVAQTLFVLHETWHKKLFGIYYCVEVVRIEKYSHMLNTTCYVAILWVLMFFWIFVHKVGQNWLVLLETWYTSIFGKYYCVDVVKI